MTGAIDTHAHLWSLAYLDELQALGSEATAVARNLGASDAPEDLTRRLAMMDNAGVQMQILSATPQSPEYGTPAEALACAQQLNAVYERVMAAHPTRFRAYGAVPLPHGAEAIGEAEDFLSRLNAR